MGVLNPEGDVMKGCDRLLAGAIAWGVIDFIVLILSMVIGLTSADYGVPWVGWQMLCALILSLYGLFHRIIQVAMAGKPTDPFPYPRLLGTLEVAGLLCLLVGLAFFLLWGMPVISD